MSAWIFTAKLLWHHFPFPLLFLPFIFIHPGMKHIGCSLVSCFEIIINPFMPSPHNNIKPPRADLSEFDIADLTFGTSCWCEWVNVLLGVVDAERVDCVYIDFFYLCLQGKRCWQLRLFFSVSLQFFVVGLQGRACHNDSIPDVVCLQDRAFKDLWLGVCVQLRSPFFSKPFTSDYA